MNTTQREEDGDGWRWYNAGGQRYISVTQVLDVAVHQKLKNWFVNNTKEKIENKLQVTADIGSRIHKAIENDLNNVSQEITDDIAAPFDKWLTLKHAHKIKAESTEKVVYSKHFGFAGTADIVGWFDDKRCVMDVKTGFYNIKAGWQMAAYREALNENEEWVEGMVGLSIKRDGSIAEPFVYSHYNFCLERFFSCLEVFKGLYFAKLQKLEWPWLHSNSLKEYFDGLSGTK